MIVKRNILIVGADLTSNGGIASVIKSHYSAYKKGQHDFKMFLLKTNYYKDKCLFYELLILIKSVFRCIYLLKYGDIGIVYVHSSAHISFYRKSMFVVLAKMFNKKVILHLHSSTFYEFFLSGSWYVSKILLLCDRVVVLCSDWENKLKIRFPKLVIRRIENPYPGIIYKQDHDLTPRKDIILLFVGFLIESKGIRDIMSLAERIKNENVNSVRIHIAGKGELGTYIINTIKEKGLEQYVYFIGWIDKELKEKAYQNADIFILPSYKEGMPITILEAMSYGLPVLSTKIGGIPDLITDGFNGYLDSPGDIYGMYKHLDQLLKDPEKRKDMGQKSVERVKLNSEDLIFKQVVELYYELLPYSSVCYN